MSEDLEEWRKKALAEIESRLDPELVRRLKDHDKDEHIETNRDREELCGHYHNSLSDSDSEVGISDISTSAINDCAVCTLVYEGLRQGLQSTPDSDFIVKFKLKPRGEFIIEYMKEGNYSTRMEFEVFLDRGKALPIIRKDYSTLTCFFRSKTVIISSGANA